jgi:hypothetical protein
MLEIEVGFDARAAAIQDSSRERSTGAPKILGFDARSVMVDCKTNYSNPMAEARGRRKSFQTSSRTKKDISNVLRKFVRINQSKFPESQVRLQGN